MRAVLPVLLGAALASWPVESPRAGSFSANPVRIVLSATAASAAVTLENQADEPVLIQAEVMAWHQDAGVDRLEPSQDVVVSPPIFRIAGGGAQIVRVGLVRPVDPARELSYRVFLKEVPSPPAQGDPQIRVALRLGLPLFVLPPVTARPDWDWQVRRTADGAIELQAGNRGRAHGQLIEVRLRSPEGLPVAQRRAGDYVLPGQMRQWRFEPAGQTLPERLRLEADTDAGAISVELPVQSAD